VNQIHRLSLHVCRERHVNNCDQDVKVVPGAEFTKRTNDRCGLL